MNDASPYMHFTYILGRQRTTIPVSLTCIRCRASLSFCVRTCIDMLCSCNSAHIALLLTDDDDDEEKKWKKNRMGRFFFPLLFQKSNRNVNATWKEKKSNSRWAIPRGVDIRQKITYTTFRRFSFFNVRSFGSLIFLFELRQNRQTKKRRKEKGKETGTPCKR